MMKYGYVSMLLALVACTGTPYVEKIYQESRNGPVLQVPAPLSQHDINHYDTLPNPPAQTTVDIMPDVL